MSAISNMSNVHNENTISSFTNKPFEESKENICNLSSEINYVDATCFMQDIDNMSINKVSSSLINQNEEFEKFQSEIKYLALSNFSDTKMQVEKLTLSKMSKYRKMEDLRRIIERVAEEESLRCRYPDNVHGRYFISEKSSISLSSQRYKVFIFNKIYQKDSFLQFNQKKIAVKSDFSLRRNISTTTTSTTETGTEGGAAHEGDRAPGKPSKQGIKAGIKRIGACSEVDGVEGVEGLCDNDEHFNNLYCYWQDNLCLPLLQNNLLCESK